MSGDDPVAGCRGQTAPTLLDASGICKRFGRRSVLSGVSLLARAGETIAVVGENGSGKTTLLRICAGLIRPDAGHVEIRATVGYCPQQPGLIDLLTADEHLALFAPALGVSRQRVLEDGHRLLSELSFPTSERTRARDLSGGARQKLSLVIALLTGAELLLLDEPYQGFDHGAYVSFWAHLEQWKHEGRAVVLVTHLLSDATLVDRVIELRTPTPTTR